MKYFTVNKQLDYDRGWLDGLAVKKGKLRLQDKTKVSGIFISRVFDSREPETEWHRFTVSGSGGAGAGLRLSFYASEEPDILYNGKKRLINDLIRDRDIPTEQKRKILEPFLQKEEAGSVDLPLFGVKGRYLIFLVELYRQETENYVSEMCLYFPKETWLKFLPGVYGRNKESADFTERFLGIFQSFYDDREMEIRASASLMDPFAADRAVLEELAGWYDLRDVYLWPDEKLRLLVEKAPELMAARGTASGLKEYLKLYTGEEPEIREDPDDPYTFSIRVAREYTEDPKEYRSLLRIIGHMKPAGMTARVEGPDYREPPEEKMYVGRNLRLFDGESEGGKA